MRLYENYIDNIKNVISGKRNLNDSFEKGIRNFSNINGQASSGFNKYSLKPLNSLEPLMNTVGQIEIKDQKLGEHPDFKHLKDDLTYEYHYITSAFIDIKNSTGLYRKYNPDVVMEITNTIQRAAIHTCVIFGGYIQRLQGDGVFVYFGGKNIKKSESIIRALSASSYFTYFVKNDLKRVFENEGVDEIYTRIGIDFGDDKKVLWSLAGIGECSEVTTYSLHTSLASKLQGIANANGIVVGDYIKTYSNLDETYFDWVKDYKGEIKKRYIFEDHSNSFYYKALDFNWFNYLKSLPSILQDENGELFHKTQDNKLEDDRIKKLKQAAIFINSGNAYIDDKGNISNNPTGIKNREHRFHYEKKN